MSLAVEAKKLCKVIENKYVLQEVDLIVQEGEIYGFLGANGAGKTSFIKILMGMYKKTSGDVKIFGQILDDNTRDVYRKIGYIVETPVFYLDYTVSRNLFIYCDYLDCPYTKIPEVLEMVGLKNCETMYVREMSLGMKQRLAIGRALLAEPKLLLLDEPINGLDPNGIKDFRALMRKINEESGVTILISSHILDEVAKIADTIGIIHNGRVLSQLPMVEIESRGISLESHYFNLIGGKEHL